MQLLSQLILKALSEPEPSPTAKGILGVFDKWQDSTFEFGLIGTLIYAGIAACITFIIIRILQRYVKKHLAGNMKIFYRLIYVAIILVCVVSVLMSIKPLQQFSSAILASSGIAAAVLGLAAQQTLGNVFSGIAISASKPFAAGEWIEILQTSPPVAGTVIDITLRHTTIRDISNKMIVIPNSVLDTEIIRTSQFTKGINVCNFLFIGVAYSCDLKLAVKTLSEVCAKHPSVLDVRTEQDKQNGVPKVAVVVTDFLDSAIQLRASVWTVDTGTGFNALCQLRIAVKEEFDKLGIEIPYPYRNVVIKGGGSASDKAGQYN